MKASNANKIVSVLLSVAMCPMMVPSAAFAADGDAASGASSPSEKTQPANQAEDVDTGTSSSDTIAPQSEAGDASTGEAAIPVAEANGEGAGATTAGEGTEAAVAEVNGKNYPSLQAAIDAAPRNATVKLLADTYENVTISTYGVTLDLNGHTLDGGTEKGKPALTVTARVTVMDSSETQTGTIMREDTAETSGVSSHYVIDIQGDGWLTFESGNVTNNSGTASGKGASLVRVGDDSVAKYPGLNIKGGNFTQNDFIVIKVDRGDLFLNGGTLNSTDSYAIEDWHRATIKGGTVNGAVAAWTYSGGSNSDLTISGGTVNGNVISVNYGSAEGKVAKVSITGGTVNGKLGTYTYNNGLAATADAGKATIKITGGAFSNDPTEYVVEDSAINKNADGTYGVAKAYLAQVGENSYYTMDEAFKAQTASGEAITLLRDYTTGSTFSSGTVARVVDLNDHTWTCTGTDANSAAFEINYPNASLTVKNGKVVSSQLIGLIPSAMGGSITYDNSTLTFENVEATTTATSGIETNGNNTNDAVVLKNSKLNVPNGFGIYFPSSGTLTIDNSTINAQTMGAQVCSGNLNVTAGSVITVSGDPVEKTEDDGAIQDGAAISIVNRAGYKGLGRIAIAGGTFTAKAGNAALKASTWDSATKQELAFDNSAKTVAVSGGTFSAAVSADLCAEGFVPVDNGDGTYGVADAAAVAQVGGKTFESVQAAIDAARDGETVTLLADATEDATVAAGKNITLNLGGKTLTNTNAGKATLTIAKGATATVKNGSIVGGTSYYTIQNNGTATLEDVTATAGNNGSSMIDNYGTLAIISGTYTGGLDTVKNEPNAKLTITGGTFTLTKGNSNGFTGVVFNYGELTISGGEFIQSDKSAPYGQAQVIHTDKSGNAAPSTVISGGTFKNLCTKSVAWTVRVTNAAAGATQVSGGAFNKSVKDYYCADGFIPTKNADGTYGVKEGSYIAEIGGTKYETLTAAINAAKNGKTIQLLNDTTENVTIAASKQITLDLNGHTLNGGTGTAKATILNEGTLTITDTSADKTGTIKRDDQGVEGETSYYVIRNIGTMVIDQANVVNNSGYKKANPSGSMVGSSLICNGDDDPQASLTINGGMFTQPNFLVVKNGSNGTLVVNGGTLTSNHSAVQNWNKAQILGGSLTGQIWTDAWAEGSIGETVIGGNAQFTGEIVVDITGSVPPTLKIEGGSLDVTSWRVTSAAAAANATVAVSGGTFTAAVPENYCAAGYAPTANADGTYGVVAGVAQIGTKAYATLAGAVAAAQDGDTITLLSDCSGDGISIKDDTFPNGLTIDFAGHSYTVGGKLVGSSGTASNGFHLLKGNTIVMRNGSIFGDASVAGDDTTQWSGSPAIMIQNYSNLTLDGMTVKGGKQTCYTLSNNNGDTVIKDSTIIAGQNNQVGGPFSFDVCRYASYPSVSVTVEGNSVIEGCVDVSGAIGDGQNRQLTITGGTFSKPISVSTQPANIAISGGAFATEIPAEHCAAGYVPTKNADGTYGVKLAEGAYLLQDYRSGDQASWTYPTQEGMAFAGWYKDAAFTTACTASDVEGAAYAKFVPITDLLKYKGRSLRMDKGDPSETTYLRFGYTKAIPNGATYIENGWYYKRLSAPTGDDIRFAAYNNALNDDGTITANLVFNKVKARLYTANFFEKAFVKYTTSDGTTVEAVESTYHSASVG